MAETEMTATERKPRYMTPEKRERLLRDIAMGQLPLQALAAQYGITHGYIRQLKSDNQAAIDQYAAEIRATFTEELTRNGIPLWVADAHNRTAIRQAALQSILEQQAALLAGGDEPLGLWEQEHWAKLETLKNQILRHLDDASGQLPMRQPPAPPVHEHRSQVVLDRPGEALR